MKLEKKENPAVIESKVQRPPDEGKHSYRLEMVRRGIFSGKLSINAARKANTLSPIKDDCVVVGGKQKRGEV